MLTSARGGLVAKKCGEATTLKGDVKSVTKQALKKMFSLKKRDCTTYSPGLCQCY